MIWSFYVYLDTGNKLEFQQVRFTEVKQNENSRAHFHTMNLHENWTIYILVSNYEYVNNWNDDPITFCEHY